MRLPNILFLALCMFFTACKKDAVSISILGASKGGSEAKVIVIMGSSTAFGTGATPIDSSWVNQLKYQFKEDNKNVTVHNLALGGYTTYHLMPAYYTIPAGRPQPDLTRNLDKALSLKPDLIIINLPSNDVSYGFNDDEINENFKTMSAEIKKHDIDYLFTSTHPRNFADAQTRQRLFTLNNQLKLNFPLNTIDYYNLLADEVNNIKPDLNYGDGIHLNNKGHRIIFEAFLRDKKMRFVAGY